MEDFSNTQPPPLLQTEFPPLQDFNLNGDDIQKLSVIQALPQLLQTDAQATYARVLPKILQELPNSSCEFHIITSKIFRLLIERQVPVNLLNAVLQGLESKDPIVINAWMETLLAVMHVLPDQQIKTYILPLANLKSQLTQPLIARVGSCKILGKLAVHRAFEPMDVKRDILPLVQGLCQDCHGEVRASMCVQLPYIAQGLGNVLMKSTLITSLVELGSDESVYVRAAAISSTVQIYPYLSQEFKKSTILPLVKQLCEKSSKSDDVTTSTLAKEIGRLAEGLQSSISPTDSLWFLHMYKTLSKNGLGQDANKSKAYDMSLDITVRQNCAANLPLMANFTLTGLSNQIDLLYGIFHDLANDTCYIVRRTVAACISDIVKIFGAHNKLLKNDMVRLLRDDSEDVLQMLIPNVGSTLELFCVQGVLSRTTSTVVTVEIGRALMKCQYEIAGGYNWRLLANLIFEFEHLPNCMPSEFIHQHFTPIVLENAVQGRAKPVRSQAVRTLLVFLRYTTKDMQRKWLRDNLINQLCYSKSAYTRHVYLRLCANALDIFSERYFKMYFCNGLFDLADDPVPNIRLCVASFFCILQQMLQPEDKDLSKRFSKILQKYGIEERDKDVKDIYRRKMEELKSAPRMGDPDEHEKEQRRRREEEDKIAAGGRGNPYVSYKKMSLSRLLEVPGMMTEFPGKDAHSSPSVMSQRIAVSSKSTESAAMNHLRNSSVTNLMQFSITEDPLVKSILAQQACSSASASSSDMSILGQHFYIDAGVSLPAQSLGEPELAGKVAPLPMPSTNITDDDKVNLRKLASGEEASQRRLKRYSSVISTACLERTQEKKAQNRRSLNLPIKESRIPVSPKSSIRRNGVVDKLDLHLQGAILKSKGEGEKNDEVKKNGNEYNCLKVGDFMKKNEPNSVERKGSESNLRSLFQHNKDSRVKDNLLSNKVSNSTRNDTFNNTISDSKSNKCNNSSSSSSSQSSPKPSHLPVFKRMSK